MDITVTPTGPRMTALEPIAVAFGRDGQGRRQIRFGGDKARYTPMLTVNGVQISAFATFHENQRTWRRGSCYFHRVDAKGDVSWAALCKVNDWFETAAPRLAEQHAERFDQAQHEANTDRLQRWRSRADELLKRVVICREFEELEEAIAAGAATIEWDSSTLARWSTHDSWGNDRRKVRVHEMATDDGAPHSGEAVAAVLIDGEPVGWGVSIRRNSHQDSLVWVPDRHVAAYG